jgi:hypothetical protein
VAIAPGQAVSHWEPTVLIVQSASVAQARADAQRSCTSVRHCALPSRHCCAGALHVSQQAPVAMNSCPAGQLCGQVSRWQTGGGGTGMMSFGPFATQVGQHPDAAKAVCSWLEQVTGAHAWMSQVGVTGTSCA